MPISTSSASKAKRGRKAKDHVCSFDGQTVNGLYRKPNGIWRVRATGQEFTEPDERQAVAKFKALTKAAKSMVKLPLPAASCKQAMDTAKDAGFSKLRIEIAPGKPTVYAVAVGSIEFYAAMRRLILEEPQATARMTGIEWLAWGPELSPPKRSSKLAELGDLYYKKSGVSANELGRSKLFWREFVAAVGVETVRA